MNNLSKNLNGGAVKVNKDKNKDHKRQKNIKDFLKSGEVRLKKKKK